VCWQPGSLSNTSVMVMFSAVSLLKVRISVIWPVSWMFRPL